MMSSSSSEAITQIRPVCSSELFIVSLAKTSSFCCSSPCTLLAPGAAQDVDQPGPADRRSHDLGRQRDVVQQAGHLPGGIRVALLLLEDEFLDGDGGGSAQHGWLRRWSG